MNMYSLDVIGGNTFFQSVSSNVILDERLSLWSEALLDIIRDPTYSKFQKF